MSQEKSQMEQNQSKSEDHINTKDFLIGALIGGMVGAAAALFLAPKSGKELRSNLNDQAFVLKEKTGQFRSSAMSKGTQIAGTAREKSNVLAQNVSRQSIELVSKVKNRMPVNGLASSSAAEDEIQRKLEETKKAFDETESKYNH